MSFMFNPYPDKDRTPVNHPLISSKYATQVIGGIPNMAQCLLDAAFKKFSNDKRTTLVIGMDGYLSAEFKPFIDVFEELLCKEGIQLRDFEMSRLYKSSSVLESEFLEYLPEKREPDPVLLYGQLFHGQLSDLLDLASLKELVKKLSACRNRTSESKEVVVVYGCGSSVQPLRKYYDMIVYFDVTPKDPILNIKAGKVKNLGDDKVRPFKTIMRRCYYIDFEVLGRLRKDLLQNDEIDYYITSDLKLIPREAFNEICSQFVKCPFRCRPVHLEGVWGGYLVKTVRRLPAEMKNCAWSFELIPLEVSVLIQVGQHVIEMPFFTVVQKEGQLLMGKECVEKFGGFFPIRFNYDDSFHSSGNMSIQVHPGDKYAKKNFGEHGRQDESYYVVATGHGAKTYVGFKENADVREFLAAIRRAETEHVPVDYDAYVNSIESRPGMQFLLPAGTIHSSGRNQVVLEIGSLTVGSYTFKLYDYLRLDFDGKPRPIHSDHGEKVLEPSRRAGWIKENLVQSPRLVRNGEDWAEYIVGEHDLMYFSLRRLEFLRQIEDNTDGSFHVITLVDGEKVRVYAKDNPERFYEMNWLDIIVVPANIGKYVIKNLKDHPVCIHKTHLKKGFQDV